MHEVSTTFRILLEDSGEFSEGQGAMSEVRQADFQFLLQRQNSGGTEVETLQG